MCLVFLLFAALFHVNADITILKASKDFMQKIHHSFLGCLALLFYDVL